jgi:hypothetical protein
VRTNTAGGPATVAGPLKTTKELARERGFGRTPLPRTSPDRTGLTEETLTSCRGPAGKITRIKLG